MDAWFGEMVDLTRTVKNVPGLKSKFLYLSMPPGRNHTGEHKTSLKVREAYVRFLQAQHQEKKGLQLEAAN